MSAWRSVRDDPPPASDWLEVRWRDGSRKPCRGKLRLHVAVFSADELEMLSSWEFWPDVSCDRDPDEWRAIK